MVNNSPVDFGTWLAIFLLQLWIKSVFLRNKTFYFPPPIQREPLIFKQLGFIMFLNVVNIFQLSQKIAKMLQC